MTTTDNTKETEYVWYACYGSNISRRRFMRYIDSCTDTTPPVEDRPFEFSHSIYFAKSSAIWDNGAVAFLDVETEGKAYGRIYKITKEQFMEVQQMEGPKYTRGLEFDPIDGLPVYSFTDVETKAEVSTGIPSKGYFDEILLGLTECYTDQPRPVMAEYLINKIIPSGDYLVAKSPIAGDRTVTKDEIVGMFGTR